MHLTHNFLKIETGEGICIYNITPQIQELVEKHGIRQGNVTVISQHTTTALTINEAEERLLEDIKTYLKKLAPPEDRYLHNDLHLRDVPEDEAINAHSHLMAMTMGTTETIPILNGKLALGTWQSVLLLELDGPRTRKVLLQFWGE
jgi:secondary thiamine-phosphate synthase enzyme